MNRRDAVQYISLLLGGTLIGGNAFLSGCKSETGVKTAFSAEDAAYLDEVANTILPDTASSPGAKAAKVGPFMIVMVNDCYEEKDQKVFHEGMKTLNDRANSEYHNDFVKLTDPQKHDLLVKVDAEQKAYMINKKKEDPSHYFRMMKELTMLGFFTSEIGCKKAQRYVETPGKYDGAFPYKKGDKSFA